MNLAGKTKRKEDYETINDGTKKSEEKIESSEEDTEMSKRKRFILSSRVDKNTYLISFLEDFLNYKQVSLFDIFFILTSILSFFILSF